MIPVVLVVHARPVHTVRVLACLRANRVPLILAFADGARGPADVAGVEATRALLRALDWREVRLVERSEKRGLGRSILDAGCRRSCGLHHVGGRPGLRARHVRVVVRRV